MAVTKMSTEPRDFRTDRQWHTLCSCHLPVDIEAILCL